MAGLSLRQLDGGALQGTAERGDAGGELTMSSPMHYSQRVGQLCRYSFALALRSARLLS